jgi:hypothetical protein
MKKIALYISITFAVCVCACSDPKVSEEKITTNAIDTSLLYFGDSITINDALASDQLISKLGSSDSVAIKLVGKIDEVCQKKGCWMNMNIGNDQLMKVRFKDYAFFVPKDAAGKTTYLEGYAFRDTIPVAELKHYAEDAGKSKEEIAKITNPEISISFEAKGVIIKK